MPNTNLDYSFDPELLQQAEALKQKEAISKMLMERQNQPLQFNGGRGSLLQVLGAGAEAYRGKQLRDSILTDNKSLAENYNTRMQAGVQDYMKRRLGTPGQNIPAVDDPAAGTYAPETNTPAVPGDPKGAMISAMMSRNPNVRNLGAIDYAEEQKRRAPFTVAADAKHIIPASDVAPEQVFTNVKGPEHAIPDDWEKHVPAGAKAEGKGIFRMKGADGQDDLYHMEFERGAYKGPKKLDSSPRMHVTNNNPAPVTVTTVAHPTRPGETLQVDARTYRGGAEGSPGVIGPGAKLTQTGGADLKLQLAKPEATKQLSLVTQTSDRLISALELLHNHKGLSGITGTVYGRTPAVTNQATGALGQLNSIKSQIFQNSLQAMRAANKTGGAVGNVSDKEGDKLERTIAALDRSMGTPEFQTEIKKAVDQVRRSKEAVMRAYEEQFGHVQNFVPPSQGGGAGTAPPPPAGFTPLN